MSLTALRTGGPHQAREQAGAGRPWRSRAGARWQCQLTASRRCGKWASATRGKNCSPSASHWRSVCRWARFMGLICVDSVCSKRTASTHPRCDCKVESSRSVEALRDVDVSGAAVSGTVGSRVATMFVGPEREETGLFDLDGEPRSLGTGGEDGQEAVVALHAVTTAGAAT